MIEATGRWNTNRFPKVFFFACLAFFRVEGVGQCQCNDILTQLRQGGPPAGEFWLKAKDIDKLRPCAVLLVKELVKQGDRDKAIYWINYARKGASQSASGGLYSDILYYKLLLDPATNPHDPWPWQPNDDFIALKRIYPDKAAALEQKARGALQKEKGDYLAARWSKPCPDRDGFWRERFPAVLTQAFQVCDAVNRYCEADKPESQSRENVKLAVGALNDLRRPLWELWGQDETQRLNKQTRLSGYYDLCERAEGPGLVTAERANLYQQAFGLVVQAGGHDTERAQKKHSQTSLMAETEKSFAAGRIPTAATTASWLAKSDELGDDFALPADYVEALDLTESCRTCKASLAKQGSDVFTPCDAFLNHSAWGETIMPSAKAVLLAEKIAIGTNLKARRDAIVPNATARSKAIPAVSSKSVDNPTPCTSDKYFETAQRAWNGEPVDGASQDEIQQTLVRLIQELKAADPAVRDTPYTRQKAQLQNRVEADPNEERRVEVFIQVRFAVRYFEAKRYLAAASLSKARQVIERARSDMEFLAQPCYTGLIHVLEKELEAKSL